MIETQEVQVGKDRMAIQSLPATRSLGVLATLTKIVGGAARGIKDVPQTPEEMKEAFNSRVLDLGGMLEGVLERVDPDPFFRLLKDIVRESLVNPQFEGAGAEQQFSDWYENRFSRAHGDLLTLLTHIFIHNYGDPVQWVGKTLARAEELGWIQPSAQSSPETPEEPSTVS